LVDFQGKPGLGFCDDLFGQKAVLDIRVGGIFVVEDRIRFQPVILRVFLRHLLLRWLFAFERSNKDAGELGGIQDFLSIERLGPQENPAVRTIQELHGVSDGRDPAGEPVIGPILDVSKLVVLAVDLEDGGALVPSASEGEKDPACPRGRIADLNGEPEASRPEKLEIPAGRRLYPV